MLPLHLNTRLDLKANPSIEQDIVRVGQPSRPWTESVAALAKPEEDAAAIRPLLSHAMRPRCLKVVMVLLRPLAPGGKTARAVVGANNETRILFFLISPQ